MNGSRALLSVTIIAVGFVLPPDQVGKPAESTTKITEDEARNLVRTVLSRETLSLPGLSLETSLSKYHQDFIWVSVLWGNPGPGSVVVTHYAVDLKTAEVWNPFVCERKSGTALAKLQRRIRKRIGLSDREYRELAGDERAPCDLSILAKEAKETEQGSKKPKQ